MCTAITHMNIWHTLGCQLACFQWCWGYSSG